MEQMACKKEQKCNSDLIAC